MNSGADNDAGQNIGPKRPSSFVRPMGIRPGGPVRPPVRTPSNQGAATQNDASNLGQSSQGQQRTTFPRPPPIRPKSASNPSESTNGHNSFSAASQPPSSRAQRPNGPPIRPFSGPQTTGRPEPANNSEANPKPSFQPQANGVPQPIRAPPFRGGPPGRPVLQASQNRQSTQNSTSSGRPVSNSSHSAGPLSARGPPVPAQRPLPTPSGPPSTNSGFRPTPQMGGNVRGPPNTPFNPQGPSPPPQNPSMGPPGFSYGPRLNSGTPFGPPQPDNRQNPRGMMGRPPNLMNPPAPPFQNPGNQMGPGGTSQQEPNSVLGLRSSQSFGKNPMGSRIDSDAMPRPLPRPEEPKEFFTRMDNKPMIPEPADDPVIVRDTGNASPRIMRMTLNCVPASSDMLDKSCMPFAVLIQPLAATQPEEDPIQVIDMGKDGPLRCGNCKAYVNPFIKWIDYTRKFVCNFCGAENHTPVEYQDTLGSDGRRRDADERPELCRGSVEFVATPEMMIRTPKPMTHFFLIDVSHTAVTNGVTSAACTGIQGVLDCIQGGEEVKVGIATFDSSIQFYGASQSQPKMMVIPDSASPYCPTPNQVINSFHESRGQIEGLLDQIPRIFSGTQSVDCCGIAAIEACIEALKASGGGKLHVFMSSLPKVGSKALNVREQHGTVNGTQPLTVMQPCSKEYRELAEDAASNAISIDLFCMAQQFVDVATLSILTDITCGQLYLYQPFNEQTHGDEFLNDLKWNIVRPQGWEAVGRLRVSEGLVVDRYYGPHHRVTLTDLTFASINSDTSLAVELRHKDTLADNREAYLQFALLFTDAQGNRRVRVHTLGLKVTMVMGSIFRGADLDSQMNFTARALAYQVPGGRLDILKKEALEKCCDILGTYRLKCATASATGQLILPESLKLLPLYNLALIKTPAFRRDSRNDERAAWLHRLRSLVPSRTLPLLYPRLFALGDLLRSLSHGKLEPRLPPSVQCLSASKLAEDGVFLLENGFEAFVYYGARIEPDLLMSLIGAPSLQNNGSMQLLPLPVLDTDASRFLHSLLDIIRMQRGRFLPVQVVPQMPPDRSPFFRSLVEDMLDHVTYVDCLCQIHRGIQKRL